MNCNLTSMAEVGDVHGIGRALDAGCEINAQDSRQRTAVMVATYVQQIDAVRLLFERGADPNIQDYMLNSPFLYAGAEGYLDILKLAHEAGADPSITNRYGGTALIPACEHGHLDVICYLLTETTVDVNHINNLGWTALLEAIVLSDGGPTHQETVRLLIDHEADVNIADHDGVTPLVHARTRGFTEIEELLREAGARS